MRRVEREARVVEKPFVPLMPHKQYNSREQPDKRMRKRSRGCKLLFRHRDGWKKDVWRPQVIAIHDLVSHLHFCPGRFARVMRWRGSGASNGTARGEHVHT